MRSRDEIIAELFKLRELHANSVKNKTPTEQNYFRGQIEALLFVLGENPEKTLMEIFLPKQFAVNGLRPPEWPLVAMTGAFFIMRG